MTTSINRYEIENPKKHHQHQAQHNKQSANQIVAFYRLKDVNWLV